MTFIRCFTFALGVGFLAGCSSANRGGNVELPAEADKLQEVNELLHAAGASRPPAKLSDLDRQRGMFPRAYEAVKSGEVVVLWGAPVKGEGEMGKGGDEVVIAYDKDVPNNGGYVLLSAGTVKKMSADEFKAAPKAGKK